LELSFGASRSIPLQLLTIVTLTAVGRARAQVSAVGPDTAVVVADPGDVLGSAKSAQARFEIRRANYLPIRYVSSGGPCDEVVGRLCVRFGEGEWIPEPEDEKVQELREELLAALDSMQALIPGDGWVLGQRVWYRGEGQDWEGALGTARGCGQVEAWWCASLEGFALHNLARYEEAASAFERALAQMDTARAREWNLPERAIDADGRAVLRALGRGDGVALQVVLDRVWWLADPLYLVAGNDRMTAHYARWTVATLKQGAKNLYRMSWAEDLEELTVRHGWEVGWERSPGRFPGDPWNVTGHNDPESVDYMPPGKVLTNPASSTADDLTADVTRPRSLYAPPYAPVLLPMEGQLALFPRGDRLVVVATQFLPEDTTYHARHGDPRPWMEAGDQADLPDEIGLFAVPVSGAPPVEGVRVGTDHGALVLDVPVGAYVISAESWSPSRRRAGRMRVGVERGRPPDDIATLSDILLLERRTTAAASLPEAADRVLSRARVTPEQSISIAWEVSGLGFRPETLRFAVSVERTDRNVFQRLGGFLGLSERPPSLELSWEEPGPDRPEPQFHSVDLDLPPLEPGTYEITLTLRTAGRSDALTRRTFEVREP
jgi:hypothetical protein